MKNHSIIFSAIALGTALLVVIVVVLGKLSVKNDAKLFADARAAEHVAVQSACGRRAEVVKTAHGWLCVYINSDGTALTRPPFDNPVGM